MGDSPPKSETNQQQQSWANLNNLFGTATNAAKGFGVQGQGALDTVTQYFKNLVGNRQAATQAVAPAANAATAGADASRKQSADMGTARTGGTAAANQEQGDKTRAQVDTLLGSVGPTAATELGTLGEADISAMMSALGLGSSATGTAGSLIGSDVNAQRQASAQMWSSLIGGAAKLAAPLIPSFSFGTSSPVTVPNDAGAADIYGGNIGYA